MNKLALGIAAVTAVGYLARDVPDMSQTWFMVPIAAKLGLLGGDIGLELTSGVITAVWGETSREDRHYAVDGSIP